MDKISYDEKLQMQTAINDIRKRLNACVSHGGGILDICYELCTEIF